MSAPNLYVILTGVSPQATKGGSSSTSIIIIIIIIHTRATHTRTPWLAPSLQSVCGKADGSGAPRRKEVKSTNPRSGWSTLTMWPEPRTVASTSPLYSTT